MKEVSVSLCRPRHRGKDSSETGVKIISLYGCGLDLSGL